MRDFQLNFFFNLRSHTYSHGNALARILSSSCRESSAKLAPREIAPHRKGVLPISIQSVYSFQIIVPVVQRIEQGFPKSKTSLLQKYAGLVSGEQIAVIKRLEYFLLSSLAIAHLPIFT